MTQANNLQLTVKVDNDPPPHVDQSSMVNTILTYCIDFYQYSMFLSLSLWQGMWQIEHPSFAPLSESSGTERTCV